jgi:ferritin-like metal-binding protein YciE
MPIQNAEDLFFTTLSHLHRSETRLQQVTQWMSQQAQDQEVKDILGTRAYLTQQAVSNIDRCFELLGKKPMPPEGQFPDVWAEDIRREHDAIQNPTLKALFALHTIRQIQNFHIGEYMMLTGMAAYMGNIPVTTLLEHNLADKVEFVERTRELVREVARRAIGAKMKERVQERMVS